MKVDLTLDEVRLLCPNVIILGYENGYFRVHGRKKIHGFRALKEYNDNKEN